MRHLKKAAGVCSAILAGNILLGFAVAAFILPSGVIMGGATGVGIVLARFIPLDTATIVLCVNLMALALGWAVLGWRFVVATIASSLLYPIFLGAAQRIPGIDQLTADPLLAALLGGGLVGIAVGLVMRVGSSTGGTDVVNLVRQSQTQLFVVSSQYEKLRQKCLTELQAGTTMVYIETGRTRTLQRGVLCVIPPRKLYAAQALIQSVDPHAFLTITQIKEVRGQGFSSERIYVESPEGPIK